MSAEERGQSFVSEMRIEAEKSGRKPDYKASAPELLRLCREFYEDPENEKAFREWKEEQKGA